MKKLYALSFFVFAFAFCCPTAAQTVAVLAPGSPVENVYSAILADELSENLTVLDSGLVASAYAAVRPAYPFNMTSDESKIVGSAIGCDFLVLIRNETQRRTSSTREEYYESYAAIFVVSSRTGNLAFWTLRTVDADSPPESEAKLRASAMTFARELTASLKDVSKKEILESPPANIEEPPLPGTPQAKNFVAPIPFARIKPEYTTTAYMYSVTATVEMLVDLDAAGNVTRTEIVRWAGYGLEGSVEKAVRTMNWRPAERNKKTLPMRVLLRYNFKKADAKP